LSISKFERELCNEFRKRLTGVVRYQPHPATGVPQVIEFGQIAIQAMEGRRFLTCLFRTRDRPNVQYGYRYDLSAPRPPWPPGQLATFLALEVDEVIEAPGMGLPPLGEAGSVVWIGE
jgi:hypothetical protein